jgi:bifunctional UDP-N-acetylglucosamine pyrophosphorylase / glucosamine-1-phosphate N-acetyltransferase
MLEVIILAAGKGTRMRSTAPKVLHKLAGKALLEHVVATARSLSPTKIHIVVGHGAEQVAAAVAGDDVAFHKQQNQLGTGHAVAQALPECDPASTVLILFGDVPLMSTKTLRSLLASTTVASSVDAPSVLAAHIPDPTGYGRVIRDAHQRFVEIVEEKDASEKQRAVQEVNTGVIAAPASLLTTLLSRVNNQNAQAEYYLPDVLGLAREDGMTVNVVVSEDPVEILGVNNRLQLEKLERILQERLAGELLLDGVAVADRRRLDIRGQLTCGEGVSIDINVLLEGDVTLGDNVSIGANCVIRDANIGANTVIQPFSHIESAVIGTDCSIGPYARLRPGTDLGSAVRIGNFVETKNSTLGAGSKANHLAYIGDTTVGEGSNIGAGTITCNYDGANKFPTHLGDGVFIGSNSTLVAPVTIANGGFVAAGSVITKDVLADDLAVGRAKQRNISGWQKPTKEEQ